MNLKPWTVTCIECGKVFQQSRHGGRRRLLCDSPVCAARRRSKRRCGLIPRSHRS